MGRTGMRSIAGTIVCIYLFIYFGWMIVHGFIVHLKHFCAHAHTHARAHTHTHTHTHTHRPQTPPSALLSHTDPPRTRPPAPRHPPPPHTHQPQLPEMATVKNYK